MKKWAMIIPTNLLLRFAPYLIVFVFSQTGSKIQRAYFAVVPTTVVLLKRLSELTNLKSDGLKSNDLHICDLNFFPIEAGGRSFPLNLSRLIFL